MRIIDWLLDRVEALLDGFSTCICLGLGHEYEWTWHPRHGFRGFCVNCGHKAPTIPR